MVKKGAKKAKVDQSSLDISIGEMDDRSVAEKIDSDIKDSIQGWQDLKNRFTEYYFDFLAYKEEILNKYKSNTFIPLPFVSTIVLKSKLKSAILSGRPYATAIPEPYDPMLSRRISLYYDTLLMDAQFRKFLDLMILDCLVYGSAPFKVVHEKKTKKLPAFYRDPENGIVIPLFDDKGERIFADEVTKDGIRLDNIHIQDFYVPDKCIDAESAPWNAQTFRKTFDEIKETPGYYNLDKLRELKKSESTDRNEKQRVESAQHKSVGGNLPENTFELIEYVTDDHIYHKPWDADFLVFRDKNIYRRKPFHLGKVYPLTNEPYGLSPLGEEHLMIHTFNEVVDVIMDGLNKEDNKQWIVNADTVNDFELRSQQGNIIHVHDVGMDGDVSKHVRAVETRAIATEIFPLIQFFDRMHQKVSGGVDAMEGIPAQGAETAYENAMLAQGALSRIEDMLSNLEDSFGEFLYADIQHLNNIYFNEGKTIQEFSPNNVEVKEFRVEPMEVWGKYKFKIDWVGRERERMQERASLTQSLGVLGNMSTWNEVTAMLIENLMVMSGVKDVERIKEALDKAIYFSRMAQMMPSGAGAAGGEEGMEKQIGDMLGRGANFKTPVGD